MRPLNKFLMPFIFTLALPALSFSLDHSIQENYAKGGLTNPSEDSLIDMATRKCRGRHLKCRRGPTGPTGPQGPTGPIGRTPTNAWLTTGNAGTAPDVNFLGTTDNQAVVIATNNLPSLGTRFSTRGQIEPLGAGALQSVYLGQGAGNNASGLDNTFIGFSAGFFNTTGKDNTAVGSFALGINQEGAQNTALGSGALLSNVNSNDSTAVGFKALFVNTANNNTAIGSEALSANTTGDLNTGCGRLALSQNQQGPNNTAIGAIALSENINGAANTALGVLALGDNTTGNGNTACGLAALSLNTTGNQNTALGFGANVNANNLSNATAIGAGAVVNANNKIRLGNAAVTVLESQVPLTVVSDGRFKIETNQAVPGLAFINKLRPMTYHMDMDKMAQIMGTPEESRSKQNEIQQSRILKSGFIAQEVEQAANAIGYDFDGVNKPASESGYYGLSYSNFVVPLIKAVQEQQQQIEELKKEIAQLKAQKK